MNAKLFFFECSNGQKGWWEASMKEMNRTNEEVRAYMVLDPGEEGMMLIECILSGSLVLCRAKVGALRRSPDFSRGAVRSEVLVALRWE